MAYGADLGQEGILVYCDAPALILCQMPVEDVHLVQGQDIYEFLHFPDAEEMSPAVQQGTPVREFRVDFDADAVQFRTGQQLKRKFLKAEEYACRTACSQTSVGDTESLFRHSVIQGYDQIGFRLVPTSPDGRHFPVRDYAYVAHFRTAGAALPRFGVPVAGKHFLPDEQFLFESGIREIYLKVGARTGAGKESREGKEGRFQFHIHFRSH